MRGGTISGNAATSDVSAFGGAISIIGTPDTGNLTNTFVMSGGTISNNKAGYGGAVSAYAADNYWHGNTSIQLSGNAQIKDNIARNYGGAICLFGNNAQNYTDTLTMSGGMISGNKANSAGGSAGGGEAASERMKPVMAEVCQSIPATAVQIPMPLYICWVAPSRITRQRVAIRQMIVIPSAFIAATQSSRAVSFIWTEHR